MRLPKLVLKSRGPIVAVDGIILNRRHEILLTRRTIQPYKGCWVLPGGHVKYEERTERAVVREVFEETGLKTKVLGLHGVYSDPKRDPRYHLIAIVYVLQIVSGRAHPTTEVSEDAFFPLYRLPPKIGLDHRQIIQDFLKKYSRFKSLKFFTL